MDISSREVIDEVAEKIKYYMQVKRREDGFDLSGPNEPHRAYPHLRTGSSLSYGKLRDRSLKHYFTPSMIKTQIANLEAVPPGSPRQRTVKKRLKRKLKPYSQKDLSSDSLLTRRQMDDDLYSAQLEALKMLHDETQQRLQRKIYSGNPVLRRAVAPTMSHGEATRLVNRSSQILVATETVALAHDIISRRHDIDPRPQSAPASRSNGLPGLYDNRARPKTARGWSGSGRVFSSTPKSHKRKPKYMWDMNGRKTLYSQLEDDVDHDHSSSYSSSSISVHLDTGHEPHGRYHRHVRPSSAMALPHNAHGNSSGRPYSAGLTRQRANLQHNDTTPRKALSPDSGFSVDAETQTRRRRRPPDGIKQAFVSSSERSSDNELAAPVQLCRYLVEIQTGDRLGAGTSADVYLSLQGDNGETDEVYLTNPISKGKKRKPFRRGQMDIFEIEAENVGQLEKIGIGHDQKEKGFSWFVDYVKVQYDGHETTFQCKTWFSGAFSQRKTFKYISLNHSPSETSSSASSSESSSETSEEEPIKQRRKKKLFRRKASSSSEQSRSSFQSRNSRKSTGAQSVEKQIEKVNAPPTFQLVVSPAEKSEENQPELNSSIPAESNKSSVEYSSDSSEEARRKGRETESLVEESEDTEMVRSSSTLSEDTLTDSSHDHEDKNEEKGKNASTASTSFTVANLFRSITKQSDDSDSSTSTTEKSFHLGGIYEKSKSFIPSFSDSGSSSSSSDDNKDAPDLAPPMNFKRRPSIAESVPINIEAALPVASSSVMKAESVKESVMEEAQITNQEVLRQSLPPALVSSSSSSSSGSESDSGAETSNSSSDVTKVSSLERSELGRSSLEETIPVATGAEEMIQTPPLQRVDRQVVMDDNEGRNIEEGMYRRLSSSSSSSSDKEGTKTDKVTEATEEVADDQADHETTSENKTSKELDVPAKEFNAAILLKSEEGSGEKSSSSSSSSSDSEGEDGFKEKAEVTSEKTVEQEAEEKAESFMEGFNAGIAASRHVAVTTPTLLSDEIIKKQEIDESLQSDEDGIVQSPRQPSVRGDIHNLIKEGNLSKVMEIVALRPELKEKTNEKGWAPIHVAATSGKLEILQWLAALGVDLKAETATGYTAMHMAAMHGHVKCVMVLHAMGGDIDAANVDKQTPLHLACMSGHLETAKWLVANRASLHAQDTFYRTPLDLADQYQHEEVSQFLTACLHDIEVGNSTMALLRSSKTSMDSSQHRSSSSSEDETSGKWHDDPEEQDKDTIAEMKSHDILEEKRKMYDKQQRKMSRRRSSFLDTIRAEMETTSEKSSSSSSDSDSSSSSSSTKSD